MDSELERRLIAEQNRLKAGLVENGDLDLQELQYIGGVDISYRKGSDYSVACLVVLEYSSLTVVYKDTLEFHDTLPYKAGLLAFKEVPYYQLLWDELMEKSPELVPQVLLVDGCGILHHRGFGSASQLGVILDTPTIGVGKALLRIEDLDGTVYDRELTHAGDYELLRGMSGKVWGARMKSTDNAANTKPIYVSVGHKIGLLSALKIVKECCIYRVPEPTRQADIISRVIVNSDIQN